VQQSPKAYQKESLLALHCRHNGAYVKGLMEQVLMDKLLGFVKQREQDGK
jgi:hypothetical protein